MSGCTNCTGKSGCDDRKGTMFAELDAALAALYPTRTWGEPSELPNPDGHADVTPAIAMVDVLAEALGTAVFWVPGGDEDACDFIYALCVGRTPCILQTREFGTAPVEAGAATDLYLRICFSQRRPFAAIQQTTLSLTPEADDEGYCIDEAPRAGVYDAPLLQRMRKAVAALTDNGWRHLDFGEIAHAPPEFHPGAWAAAYGAAPALANYFFYAAPTTMTSSCYLPRAALTQAAWTSPPNVEAAVSEAVQVAPAPLSGEHLTND